MWNDKRPILIAMLICVGFVPVCSAKAILGRTKEKYPTAFELLDKYAATQDMLQRSFIIKSEVSSVYSGVAFGGTLRADGLKTYSIIELRYDGERTCNPSYEWGQRDARTKKFIPRDKASYSNTLWDGQRRFNYHIHPSRSNPLGTVIISQEPSREQVRNMISFAYNGHEIFGFFYGEYERVDSVLRKVSKLSVRDSLEKIGGSNCYVIDAETQGGKYALWIDPKHGYNIAKAEVRWGENLPPYGAPNWRVKSAFNSVSNVRFRKIHNLWVPVEDDIVLNRNWHNGELTKQSWHHKLTEVILRSDHEALSSFVPDDIKNGAKVRISGADAKYAKGKYTWQDGKVVDEKGRVIMDCRPKKASGSAGSKPKSAVPKRPSAWELPRKYTVQQANVTAPRSKERVVHFPKDRSVGWLYLVERPLPKDCLWREVFVSWEKKLLGEAQGDVRVPTDKMLRLDVGKNAWQGGRPFAGLKPDDIQILNFPKYPHASDSALKDVARLTGLEVLFFGEGNFTERGLKHLTALKHLKALKLPGRTPSRGLTDLQELPSLEYLCFAGSMVTDAKMFQIGRLTSLTQLSIGGSRVGRGLVHLKGLKSLRYLNLQSLADKDIDKHLTHLSGMTELLELDLRNTAVSDAGLAHLAGLTKLRKLYLRSNPATNKITDAGMVHLKNLRALEEIDLPWGDDITDTGFAFLADLDSLKKLNACSNGITDKSMATFAQMKSLEELDLMSRNLTDAGMEKLAKCLHLRCLDLQRSPITDAGLAHLGELKTLRELWIRKTQVTGNGLTVLKELPLLTRLYLHYVYFGEVGTAHLADLKSLERLGIFWPETEITDDDLAYLSRITSLKYLDIHGRGFDGSHPLITDHGLAHLGNLKALETLTITSCPRVTDAGLKNLEELTSLKQLRLDKSRITNAGVARLKAKIPGVMVTVQTAAPRRNAQPELRNKPGRTVQRRVPRP